MIGNFAIDLKDYRILNLIVDKRLWSVYLVENIQTKIRYVAKVSKTPVDNKTKEKSFFTDIENFSLVKNPAVLGLTGFSKLSFNLKPYPTIITDFVQNGSLKNFFEREKQTTPPAEWTDTTRYLILLGISLGMKYLHSKGFIHQSLDPENILLDEHYYPRISDYSLSKEPKRKLTDTQKSALDSTIYTAPEIKRGRSFNNTVDAFSFSLIAYQLITKENPPIDYSRVSNDDMVELLKRCNSKDSYARPTFQEIIDEITKESFKKDFGVIDEKEIINYLDLFEGDPEVMNILGIMIRKEDGSNLYKIEAGNYYKMAADKGHVDAMYNYGMMLYKGEGIKKNRTKAAHYLREAADKGQTNAMFTYGMMLFKGDGIKEDKEKACHYVKMAADEGHVDAMFNYGLMLYNGDGVETDKQQASRFYKMAADKGNVEAMFHYGWMLGNGKGIEINQKEACRYYKMAADKGHSKSMFNYGWMLSNGEGVEIDNEEALHYYKMAAEKGHVKALYYYGLMLYNGEGIKANKKEGCRIIKKAADKGDVEANLHYGTLLTDCKDVGTTRAEACFYYKNAADKGSVDAMHKLGLVLYKGDGTIMDKKEASRYFKNAADNGNANSMFQYGWMLSKGDGIDADKPKEMITNIVLI